MDHSTLLLAEVIGMVGIAFLLTFLIAFGAPEAPAFPGEERRPAPEPEARLPDRQPAHAAQVLPVLVFCPRTTVPTRVTLGIREDPEPVFHLLDCEQFPEGGIACHGECVAVAQA